jgi:hypothetical protein
MAGDRKPDGSPLCRAWSMETPYRSSHRCKNRGTHKVPYSGAGSGVIELCGIHLRGWRSLGGRLLTSDVDGARIQPVPDGPYFSLAEWTLYRSWKLAGPHPLKEQP